MTDQIQDDLQAWVEHSDGDAGERALMALQREWRKPVRRMLASPDSHEVEEFLQQALLDLAVARGPDGPRALAPPGTAKHASYRRKVLKNHLIDRMRKQGRRRHAVDGLAQGLSPQAEAETWAQTKRERRGEPFASDTSLTDARRPSAPIFEAVEPLFAEHAPMRQSVLKVVGELALNRRVTLLLAMRASPLPYAAELAQKLEEEVGRTETRMLLAQVAPLDGTHEYLSEPMVRVPWPWTEPLSKAADSARKALERGMVDLRAKLGVEA